MADAVFANESSGTQPAGLGGIRQTLNGSHTSQTFLEVDESTMLSRTKTVDNRQDWIAFPSAAWHVRMRNAHLKKPAKLWAEVEEHGRLNGRAGRQNVPSGSQDRRMVETAMNSHPGGEQVW